MKYDFITIGGSVIDETFQTDEGVLIDNTKDLLRQKLVGFEYGAKIVLNDYNSFFGGGAANTAVCLAGFGFKTSVFTQIGKDQRGENILENFKKNKVSTKFVKFSKNNHTGFSFVLVTKDNEHVAFMDRGANNDLSINFIEKKALNQTRWIYISSLSGEWEDVLWKAFSLVGVKKAWNPGGKQLQAGITKLKSHLKKTDVFIVNKDEAIELVMSISVYKKKGASFLKKIENLLKILKEFVAGTVVITDGKNGAYAFDGKKIYYEKSVSKGKIADTTGVGDAFSASFVAGIDRYNGNISKAMKLGARNSASVLAKSGAQNGLIKI